jgi:tripartite-type tricarboxylate transporter receptor subunit TctC
MQNAWSRRLLVTGLLSLGTALASAPARAESYPNRPVRLLVGASPGSAPDVIARLVANRLSQMWTSAVVVENHTGAAGSIVAEIAAKAPSDGYTLLFAPTAILAINQFTSASLPYNPQTDFDPVIFIGDSAMLICVNPKLPVHNLAELLSYVKSRKGSVDYATPSFGGVAHLTGELLSQRTGIRLTHVTYSSSPEAFTDVARGDVGILIDGIPPLVPHVRAGAVRPIAVTGRTRSASLPDVPALVETYPGLIARGWFAIMVPHRTPVTVVDKLAKDIGDTLKLDDIRKRLTDFGVDPIPLETSKLNQFINAERKMWGETIAKAGIKPK